MADFVHSEAEESDVSKIRKITLYLVHFFHSQNLKIMQFDDFYMILTMIKQLNEFLII